MPCHPTPPSNAPAQHLAQCRLEAIILIPIDTIKQPKPASTSASDTTRHQTTSASRAPRPTDNSTHLLSRTPTHIHTQRAHATAHPLNPTTRHADRSSSNALRCSLRRRTSLALCWPPAGSSARPVVRGLLLVPPSQRLAAAARAAGPATPRSSAACMQR